VKTFHRKAFYSFCGPVKNLIKTIIIWCIILTWLYQVTLFEHLDLKSQVESLLLQSHHNCLQYSYCLCCSKTSEGTLRCWVRASRASARSWWRSTWSRRTASQHSSVLSPSTSSTSKPLHSGDGASMFPNSVHWHFCSILSVLTLDFFSIQTKSFSWQYISWTQRSV